MELKQYFLPYKLAVQLKEKGFNETCIALITEKDFLIPLRFDDEEELEFNQEIKKHNNVPCIPTPMYQQAIDWFDKEHNITIDSYAEYDNYGCEVCVRSKFGWLDGVDMDLKGFKTRNEAVNEGILTALGMIDDKNKTIK